MGFGLVLTGLSGALLIRWPSLIHAYALAAAVGLGFAWWRARPSYGRNRGWPPGSLGIGASLDAIGDRRYYSDQAALHGPVFKMSQFGRPVLCVLGLARGRDLLLSQAEAFVPASLAYNRFVPKGSLRYMTAAQHQNEGPLFRSALGSVDLGIHERAARETCRAALAQLSAESRKSPGGIPPRDPIGQWVFVALARVFFGLEDGDARLVGLNNAQRVLRLDRAGGRRWRKEMEESFEAIAALMQEQAQDDASNPSTSALDAVLAADPELLTSEARTRNFILIFRLAVGDVGSLLDWVVTKLTENPGWQDQVRGVPPVPGGPRGSQPDDVASRVILETLRMEQSEYLYRRLALPIGLDGFQIPAGWLVRICVQESHRDPAIFKDPETFDPNRFAGRSLSRREYAPFGADDRGCMGVPMVHFLGRLFVEELCGAYEVRETVGGAYEKGTRHRDHWRPSAARRVVLTPLS